MQNWKEIVVNELNGKVKFYGNKVKFTNIAGGEVVTIPSRLYPLNDTCEMFCEHNTEDFDESLTSTHEIKDIMNKAEYERHCCYTNSDKLLKTLIDNNINAEMYVGWMFVSANLFPIHHAWIVIDNNKFLDLTTSMSPEQKRKCQLLSSLMIDGVEAFTFSEMLEMAEETLDNTERGVFGKVTQSTYYIGSKCNRKEGINIFIDLAESYPNHPVEYIRKQSEIFKETKKVFKKGGILNI